MCWFESPLSLSPWWTSNDKNHQFVDIVANEFIMLLLRRRYGPLLLKDSSNSKYVPTWIATLVANERKLLICGFCVPVQWRAPLGVVAERQSEHKTNANQRSCRGTCLLMIVVQVIAFDLMDKRWVFPPQPFCSLSINNTAQLLSWGDLLTLLRMYKFTVSAERQKLLYLQRRNKNAALRRRLYIKRSLHPGQHEREILKKTVTSRRPPELMIIIIDGR